MSRQVGTTRSRLAAQIGGFTPRVLGASGAGSAALTGTTSETILGYVNIPAGLLGPNSAIEVDTVWDVTGTGGTWDAIVRLVAGTSAGTLAGTALLNSAVTAGNKVRWNGLICNANSLSSQFLFARAVAAFTSSTAALGTSAIDTAAAFTLSINGKLASAGDSLTLKYMRVGHIPGV